MKVYSAKRSRDIYEYKKVRRKYLNEHPNCVRCYKPATDVHHRKSRRGDLLLDVKYFISVCRTCHQYIEEHPDYAKKYGYSISRL